MYLDYTKGVALKNVKIGKSLPPGAIEIARFDRTNKNDEHVNAGQSYNTIQDISSSQHKEITQWKRIAHMLEPDESLFPKTIAFDDGTYEGTLHLVDVEFEKYERYLSKPHEPITKEYRGIGTTPPMPETSIFVETEDGYSGYMYISSMVITESAGDDQTSIKYEYYIPAIMAVVNAVAVIGMIPIEVTLYHATIRGATGIKGENAVELIWLKPLPNGEFEQTVIMNYSDGRPSQTYTFTGKTKEISSEKLVRHYGICRYWGGGSSRPNNYYGNPDKRFHVDGWTAKGYFSDVLPAPTLSRYGHAMNVLCGHSPQNYPSDNASGYWDTTVGEKDGLPWKYDVDAAVKYGGANSEWSGGAVWASQFNSSNWPPYKDDFDGAWVRPLASGNNGTMNPNGYVVTKNGAQKTSRSGHYNSNGWYCKWFRDIVLFYVSRTGTTVREGQYSRNYVASTTIAYVDIMTRVGLIKKWAEVIETASLSIFKFLATYSGNVYKLETTYSGVATYKGDVYKKYLLNKVDPVVANSLMAVGSSGYLEDLQGDKNVRSSYVEITDISLGGIPLYYKYKCTKVAIINGETRNEFITESGIASVSGTGFKYLFHAKKAAHHLYDVTLLTDIPISHKDNVYLSLLDDEEPYSELVSSELLYKQGVDFKVTMSGDMTYLLRHGSSGTISDNRRKINASFKVITESGLESNTYSTSVINRKYALSGELDTFIQDMMQVEINDRDGYVMTAIEILARDNGVEKESLSGESFFIYVSSHSGVVDAYTDVDGLSPVYISTLEDTGSPDGNGGYTGVIESYRAKVSVGNTIRNAFFVKERGVRLGITAHAKDSMRPTFAKIHCSSFKVTGIKSGMGIEALYPLVFEDDYLGSYGMPFVNGKEVAMCIDSEVIISGKAIIGEKYITVKSSATGARCRIRGVDVARNSVIIDKIFDGEEVTVEYIHIKNYMEYKGYSSTSTSVDDMSILDLNTGFGHRYWNGAAGTYSASSSLINKTIYIFIRPKTVTLDNGEVLVNNTGKRTVYHQIDNPQSADEFDSLLGIVYLENDSNKEKFKITISDIVGGGVREKYIIGNENKLSSLYDVCDYVEKYIKTTGVTVTSIDSTVHLEEDIKPLIDKYLPLGTLNVIE